MTPRDLLWLCILAAIWGASYPFIRVAVPDLGPLPLVLGRVSLAALVLYLGLRISGQRPEMRRHAGKLLILGALNAAVPFSLISAAELHITASLAAMLTATTPMWSAVFSALWLGERLTLRRASGLTLGVIGVGVLVGWSPLTLTGTVVLSILGVIAATASYALATVYSRKTLSGVPGPTLALGQQLGAAVWLMVPGAIGVPQVQVRAASLGALVMLAVLCTAVAYVIFFQLLARIGATKVSTVTYLIPVFGTAWGTLFLHEAVSLGMLAGIAMILLSVVVVNEVRVAPAISALRGRVRGAPSPGAM